MKLNDLYVPAKSGAGCLLVAGDTGRFMLIQRSELVPAPLIWSLPGGTMDDGEDLETTAKREVLEETGLDIRPYPLKLIYVDDSYAPRFRYHTYACVVNKELIPILNWESADFIWCDLDTMPNGLHQGIQQLINYDKAATVLKDFIAKRRGL